MRTAALERIDPATCSPAELAQHLERYRFAAEHTAIGETVLDAACGTGYAREMFEPWARWIGVDAIGGEGIITADLHTWDGWCDLDYDVFVGLETIEHLHDPALYLGMARKANRAIVLSTPIIPTVGENPFHLRDFTANDLVDVLADDRWQITDYHEQDGIYGLAAWRRAG